MHSLHQATKAEAMGLAWGFERMRGLGYELIDESFSYGFGAVYRNRKIGDLAILKAKASGGLNRFELDKSGMTQGGHDYNLDRVRKYLNRNPDSISVKVFIELMLGNVKSFGSSGGMRRLWQFDFIGAPKPLRTSGRNAKIIPSGNNHGIF